MHYTNEHNLPESFVKFATNDKYSKGQADISVTTLIDSPKIRLMRDHFGDLMQSDVSDRVWALFGTAVHGILESDDSEGVVTEERLFSMVNGWLLSGAVDHQKIVGQTVEITDYKVTSVWSVIYGKVEWERQLNVYAYLVQKNKGKKVTSLKVCAVLRDWNRREASVKPEYPQRPVIMVDIPMWSEEERIDYVHERVRYHQGAQSIYDLEIVEQDKFLPCTKEERWHRGEAYAVKKKGLKRAVRVFDTRDEAEQYIGRNDSMDGKPLEIEYRAGEFARCKGNYCGVAEFCSQYRGD